MTEHTPTPWMTHRAGELLPDDWMIMADLGKTPNGIQEVSTVARALSIRQTPETTAANAAFIVKAVNNHDALLAFFKWAMQEGPWEGGDLDGGDVQDKAESLGLIVSAPYDPEKHGAYNNYGCDAGDPWFEFSPLLSGHVPTPSGGE